MAKQVKKRANKDYPEDGIKKGNYYWYAALKTGPRSSVVIRSLSPIKRYKLTTSEFLSKIWMIEDAYIPNISCLEDVEILIEALQNIYEDCQNSFGNLPEGLRNGPTGEMLDTRSNGCERAVNDFETIFGEWSDAVDDEDFDEDEYIESARSVSIEY